MGVADSILSAIPGVRRWWWRHKWSSLDVPAEEWAKLDAIFEDGFDELKSVKSLEKLILDAATLSAGHGMNTTVRYHDMSGKEHVVSSIIDGSSASESLLQGYQKQMDARRRKMIEFAVKAGNWAADNAIAPDYPDRPPLHTRMLTLARNVKRIAAELSEARQGRTPHEFLRYALLDEEARKKRLAISPTPERVKLKKPEPEPPKEAPKPKHDDGAENRRIAALLPEAFNEQGITVRFDSFQESYSVTRYSLKLERGQKLAKAEGAADEIAMRLGVDRVAISRVPNKTQMIYVDVPNRNIKPLLYADTPKEEGKFFVGMGIDGKPVFTNMESLCHVLIAGTTGSGKSVFLNTMICSLIQSPPSEVQFIMIDPKLVELTPYNGIPHLTRPVITDAAEAVEALGEAAQEMDDRYRIFMETGTKKLSEYNAKAAAPFPRLIVVIDELSDLMMISDKEVEASVIRIAQKGRAAGVHLVIATQRPTADVVTGLIKANIPSRIAFAVASAMESRIILDKAGAENLCGKGDMIFKPLDGKAQRLQGAYVDSDVIERIVKGAKY